MPQLSEIERRAMLEQLAQDTSLKATQRLRALEEIGRMDSRGGGGGPLLPHPDQARDPFEDFDEMEMLRRRRARK